MTYFSIRFARLAALAALLITAGCTIHSTSTTYETEPTAGEEAEKDKDKDKDEPKKDDKPEAKPKPKPKPEKEDKPKPDKPEEDKPAKPDKPKEDKPASKPDKPKDEKPEEPKDDKPADKPKDDKPADKPKEDKPKDDKPAPKPPQPEPLPEQSKIVLPVKVAIDALEKELEALVPKTDKKDWQQITKGDESPKAELKYELWRDPIKVELDGRTFHITVPVRYASTIRAQVKNPITKDWFWIAKDETWGTKDEPQRITAHFEAKIGVEEDWKIKSDLKLVKLEHGAAPSGAICKTVAVKVCVEKASIADEVREGIDKRLEPKLRKALEQIDGKVERAFDLKKRAEKTWAEIQKPQQIPAMVPIWLVLRPSAVAVSGPSKDGGDVRVDLAFEARIDLTVGEKDKPKVKAVPLPKLTKVEGEPGFRIHAKVPLSRKALSATFEQSLDGFVAKGKRDFKVVRSELVAQADPKNPNRITVKVAFGEGAEYELELTGELAYDAARQILSVQDFDTTPNSKTASAAKLAGIDIAALEKEVAKRARWSLADQVASMRKSIEAALGNTLKGQAAVRGELNQLDLRKLVVTPETIETEVIIGGALEVEVKR